MVTENKEIGKKIAGFTWITFLHLAGLLTLNTFLTLLNDNEHLLAR